MQVSQHYYSGGQSTFCIVYLQCDVSPRQENRIRKHGLHPFAQLFPAPESPVKNVSGRNNLPNTPARIYIRLGDIIAEIEALAYLRGYIHPLLGQLGRSEEHTWLGLGSRLV